MLLRAVGVALALLFCASIVARAEVCSPREGLEEVTNGSYRLFYDLAPKQPKVGQPFIMTLQICPPDPAPFNGGVNVDAYMPDHKHGMNYSPEVSKLHDGLFQAQGFLLHMPGRWQFRFSIRDRGRVIRLNREHIQR